ncbi:MAG TPA: hypothetical protein VGO93_23935 [Candidatus Xenobia bacterium]
MIIDVPTHDDFLTTGEDFVFLAADQLFKLLGDFEDIQDEEYIEDPQKAEETYWSNAQRVMSTSLALLHQGAELLLKGRIAAVSPYLLLFDRNWRADPKTNNVAFADLRSIDAIDLVRVHDQVSSTQLTAAFAKLFEDMRRLRNSFAHGVQTRRTLTASKLLIECLAVHEEFFGPRQWNRTRRAYLEERTPLSIVPDEYGWSTAQVVRELSLLTEMLVSTPADSRRFIGFDRKDRRFECVDCAPCARRFDIDFDTLVLSRDKQKAVCVVCGKETAVSFKNCSECGCKHATADEEGRLWCLRCDAEHRLRSRRAGVKSISLQ